MHHMHLLAQCWTVLMESSINAEAVFRYDWAITVVDITSHIQQFIQNNCIKGYQNSEII